MICPNVLSVDGWTGFTHTQDTKDTNNSTYLATTLIINVQMSQVPEFENAAFSAPLNKVVRCKTKFGWHLLQVISERYAKESYSISFLCQREGSIGTYSYFSMNMSLLNL